GQAAAGALSRTGPRWRAARARSTGRAAPGPAGCSETTRPRPGRAPTAASPLAHRAIERGPAPLNDASDHAPAAGCWAGLMLAVIDGEAMLEIAQRPISRGEVAQGRTTLVYGFPEHRLDRGHKRLKLARTQSS